MKIRAKENLKWRDEDVCFTVYNFDTDELFQTSRTGIDILQISAEPIDEEKCIDYIINKFSLDEEKRVKIAMFIQLLVNKQLIDVLKS